MKISYRENAQGNNLKRLKIQDSKQNITVKNCEILRPYLGLYINRSIGCILGTL